MTVLTEGAHTGEFLISEASGTRSREIITLPASTTLEVGELYAETESGARTATASAVASGTGGTPGNGAISSVSADANARDGEYDVIFIEPVNDLGTFQVFQPDGKGGKKPAKPATGTVGTAYNGTNGVNFTVADGANNFVAGDRFTISVSTEEPAKRHVPWDPTATDGKEIVAGISFDKYVTASGETLRGVGIAHDAEVNGNLLAWPAEVTDAQMADGRTQLGRLGINVR